jgi:hypothetical protein
MEFLKSKKKHSFKRRESLNKKGWTNDSAQKKMDDFLVPKKRKKVEDTQFNMMGCSDSFSCMPSSSAINTNVTPSSIRYRSRRRIDKLMGKTNDQPITRSRLTSMDMQSQDEFSDFRQMKNNKRRRLNMLKNDDFSLMFA